MASFKLSNPALNVVTHWHIPAFVINALRLKKPGILLIRQPLDAALSWAIFWEGRMRVEDALDYYADFHRTLLPHRRKLFVATFAEATGRFEDLLDRFNDKFGTKCLALPPGNGNLNRCVSYVEDLFRAPDGSLNEFTVPRPSPQRAKLKAELLEQMGNSPRLLRKLAAADELYTVFRGGSANNDSLGSGSDAALADQSVSECQVRSLDSTRSGRAS
jgi:hypothetical protein